MNLSCPPMQICSNDSIDSTPLVQARAALSALRVAQVPLGVAELLHSFKSVHSNQTVRFHTPHFCTQFLPSMLSCENEGLSQPVPHCQEGIACKRQFCSEIHNLILCSAALATHKYQDPPFQKCLQRVAPASGQLQPLTSPSSPPRPEPLPISVSAAIVRS